ncbi:MAG: DUF6036 family nucleotidyltransferase [Verrucomicrobiota bacterium]
MDVLRDSIFETLPPGWKERLVPVPECAGALALDPHDLAATKLLVAREKDIALMRHLGLSGRVSPGLVEQRLETIPRTERLVVISSAAFSQAFVPGSTNVA